MSNLEVAQTIYMQLGGNKFKVMTGARDFVGGENWLSFKIGQNLSKANYLKITLNGLDLYDMEFRYVTVPRFNSKTASVSKGKNELLQEYKDVYFDQLQEFFTQYTGMYTSLSE